MTLTAGDENGPVDALPAKPTVFEAWNAVMQGVQAIRKDSRNDQQRFNFRGIDAVMNAVGPLLRENGVTVVPVALKNEFERYASKSGGQMVNRLVEVGFTVFGPAGDHFDGVAYGEAADAGDKAMSKAHSVALRTFLLQSLMIPTDDPDPDSVSHERAASVPPSIAAAPVGNPGSTKAREDLKAVAGENGWELAKVAAAFSKASEGQELKDASAEVVEAFTANLVAGTIKL